MYSYGPPHMAGQKPDDQPEHPSSSYVILNVKASRESYTNLLAIHFIAKDKIQRGFLFYLQVTDNVVTKRKEWVLVI